MDVLKQQLAPISDAAWEEIEEEAKRTFALNLSARRIVDVCGPKGLELGAVNTGRLELPDDQPSERLRYGIREVLPLVEVRAVFELDLWELDNVDRGAKDPDLANLNVAAKELSRFEERLVYDGFEEAGIAGLVAGSGFAPVPVGDRPEGLPEAVGQAVLKLRYADVDGPYALALGAALYRALDSGSEHGYPLRRRIEKQVGGPIVLAPYLEGGLVISKRGGDAELTLGQDISIGYSHHDSKSVSLYLSESFTFRVLTPEAVVALRSEATA